MPFRQLAQLKDVAPQIRDNDLLLFRRRGLIATAGRSIYSHAAKAIWWDSTLFCVEVREWFGGRAVTLASQIRRNPDRIDLFRTNPDNRWPNYNPFAAARYMINLAGSDYGYASVISAAMLHLPFVRLFVKPDMQDDAIDHRPPYCSQACSMADRIGGLVDPTPYLADRLTEPGDLARSPLYQYQFTLAGAAS